MKAFKTVKELQLNDPFYIVRRSPMDDHKFSPTSIVNHVRIDVETVRRMEIDESNENIILVKGNINAKPYGVADADRPNNNPREGDIITDYEVAQHLALQLLETEEEKANKLIVDAEKQLKEAREILDAVKQNKNIQSEKPNPTTMRGRRGGFRGTLVDAVKSQSDEEVAEKVED